MDDGRNLTAQIHKRSLDLPDELKDRRYYEYGDNKTEQAARRYWEEIKK